MNCRYRRNRSVHENVITVTWECPVACQQKTSSWDREGKLTELTGLAAERAVRCMSASKHHHDFNSSAHYHSTQREKTNSDSRSRSREEIDSMAGKAVARSGSWSGEGTHVTGGQAKERGEQ